MSTLFLTPAQRIAEAALQLLPASFHLVQENGDEIYPFIILRQIQSDTSLILWFIRRFNVDDWQVSVLLTADEERVAALDSGQVLRLVRSMPNLKGVYVRNLLNRRKPFEVQTLFNCSIAESAEIPCPPQVASASDAAQLLEQLETPAALISIPFPEEPVQVALSALDILVAAENTSWTGRPRMIVYTKFNLWHVEKTPSLWRVSDETTGFDSGQVGRIYVERLVRAVRDIRIVEVFSTDKSATLYLCLPEFDDCPLTVNMARRIQGYYRSKREHRRFPYSLVQQELRTVPPRPFQPTIGPSVEQPALPEGGVDYVAAAANFARQQQQFM